MNKDFWRNSKVGVIGGGTWGTVLAHLVAPRCREVRIWVRDEESVRSINSTRVNPHYVPNMQLSEKIHAFQTLDRLFEGGVDLIIWALPSRVCRTLAREVAPLLSGHEILLHATKGIEPGTMKRISEILLEELPCRRIGVISGPNLAAEIAKGESAATVVASNFAEVCEAGKALLNSENFRTYCASDVIGVEWAGVLKNILAIASGALDSLEMGWNARSMLITLGLAEMVRFGVALGAHEATFLSLAGVGDLLATCNSPLSRNYQVGYRLAKGEKLEDVLGSIGSTAEGVMTTETVRNYARQKNVSMPITEGVHQLIQGEATIQQIIHQVMRA